MSIKALFWAFEQEVFPATQKLLLITLANFAGETGKTFPSISTICRMTSLHEDTVVKALLELCAKGLLHDTGKTTGLTGRVKVYELPEGARSIPLGTGVLQIPGVIPEQSPDNPPVFRQPLYRGTRNKEQREPSATKKFIKPTLEEVQIKVKEMGMPLSEAEAFFDHHQSKGWIIGRVPMKDWHAALRTWKRNWKRYNPVAAGVPEPHKPMPITRAGYGNF